ncbi:MAG: glycosyltransferase family 8 protein, partial [Moorea sp. SIO4G2]|nr:glycosyltransferase family 8 protein [Moorena sp. SIO4G2]
PDGKGTLEIHQIAAERLAKFPENRHTLNTYLRLLIPEIIPKKDKIIYLDADIIVLDSLQGLWNHSVKNFTLAATADSQVYFGGIALEHFESLKLPSEHLYFNAGVLLLNLKLFREVQLFEKVLTWTEKNSHLMIHSDQDALNAVLAGKITYFHPRWNLQVPLIDPVRFGWGCTQEQAEAVANPAIIHYVTHRKPWYRQYKLPYQQLYFQYLAQTPWKDDPFPPCTFHMHLHRLREELDWCYKWVRSRVRRVLGRHPKPIKGSLLGRTLGSKLGTNH